VHPTTGSVTERYDPDKDMTATIDLCAIVQGDRRSLACVAHNQCLGAGHEGLGFGLIKSSRELAIASCRTACIAQARDRRLICDAAP